MKSILVPVETHPGMRATLEIACLWASEFGSYIEGFALRPALPAFVGADALGAGVPYVYPEQDAAAAVAASTLFQGVMAERGVTPAGGEGIVPSFGWLSNVFPGDSYVGTYGRVFDITIVGQPGSGGSRMSTLEAALFDSGRPVLLVPPDAAPTKVCDSILIAWNGSSETARAIAFAWPLLSRAGRVVVLTVQGGNVPDPAGEDVARHLRRSGARAEARTVVAGSRSVGEAILDETLAVGADVLIKGAYTQSRLRQIIFGGSTRHIIAEAKLPVFLAH